MDNPHKPLWSIGELAAATGVTVRALHHYDSIGLLRAGVRTAAGHRRYTEEDLRRLYGIRTLRSSGYRWAGSLQRRCPRRQPRGAGAGAAL